MNCTEGYCEDEENGFVCVCNVGYEGEYCERGKSGKTDRAINNIIFPLDAKGYIYTFKRGKNPLIQGDDL